MEVAARGRTFKYSGDARANDPAWRVVLVIGRSRRVATWVAALAAATVAVALELPVQVFAKVLLVGVTLAGAVRSLRRHALQEGRGGARRFVVELAGRVELELSDGTVVVGRLAEGSFVAPWLTIVRWQPAGARLSRTLVIAPDAVDAEAFRRLRVLLRWR
jgi:hypothetical protein